MTTVTEGDGSISESLASVVWSRCRANPGACEACRRARCNPTVTDRRLESNSAARRRLPSPCPMKQRFCTCLPAPLLPLATPIGSLVVPSRLTALAFDCCCCWESFLSKSSLRAASRRRNNSFSCGQDALQCGKFDTSKILVGLDRAWHRKSHKPRLNKGSGKRIFSLKFETGVVDAQ